MALRVAFLGPPGTFTEEALVGSAPSVVGERYEAVAVPTVYETVMAVQQRDADRAVVPIENALEGGVSATLDTLAGDADEVRIAAEVIHPISHCLIAAAPAELGELRRVISHPQAMAQCARFLRERLPAAERATTPSTSEAIRQAVEGGGRVAAIGARLGAELYGGTVLAEGIEDSAGNETRFVWLAPSDAPRHGEASKTSVVFWGFNDESPGALVDVLREFSERGINLTRIESRPRRVRLGHYMFFADLEGSIEEERVREALDAVAARLDTLRVLGSYPAAVA